MKNLQSLSFSINTSIRGTSENKSQLLIIPVTAKLETEVDDRHKIYRLMHV